MLEPIAHLALIWSVAVDIVRVDVFPDLAFTDKLSRVGATWELYYCTTTIGWDVLEPEASDGVFFE